MRETVHVNTDIKIELHKEVKEYCKKHGFKIHEFVAIAIKNEIERRKRA